MCLTTDLYKYSIPVGASHDLSLQNVTLIVYDVLGREIATLVNKEKPAGKYAVEFNSHSRESGNLTSGVYFYRLQYSNFSQSRKMIILK
ncbi:hypothetical protein MNBD_IGNAVI01-1024 [hydrothermal vent metagenome]|uniref:Secretion system C-terminal sorting domain-containing protein n=1 Tax=hydrothermal vent metagenome TaxID=652676 RepID=A0A3B1C210_9ZZZZ